MSQVKRSKINLLRSQYENFFMLENECIDEMLTQFTKITNCLSSLGDKIDNDQKIQSVGTCFDEDFCEAFHLELYHTTNQEFYMIKTSQRELI